MFPIQPIFLASLLWLLCPASLAQQEDPPMDEQSVDECLRLSVAHADRQMTVKELENACRAMGEKEVTLETVLQNLEVETPAREPAQETRLLTKRLRIEALNRANRFMLTPHRRNYLLPASYISHPNRAPYEEAGSELVKMKNTEVEFQISVKILLRESILGDNGHLYMAYTNHSFLQAYSADISRPFRETNHQPELVLSFLNDWEIFGFRNVVNEVILNHQSNGQSGVLSRSWDRVMLNTVFERGPFVLELTPWYRIPEDERAHPNDPRGDDNPDIEKYMGNFELSGTYQRNSQLLSVTMRNNLRSSDNRGAWELSWSFPVSSTVRGYLKYFNGYGHSLIDYDSHTQALGLGIVFTDLF